MDHKDCILIVDDDPNMRNTLHQMLEYDNFQTLHAENGTQMRDHISNAKVSLVLLDLILVNENGLDLARVLRDQTQIPFIIITGQTNTMDKIIGLELGADDYITKPFHPRELLARINIVLRRQQPSVQDTPVLEAEPEPQSIYEFLNWEYHVDTGRLTKQDELPIIFTTYENLIFKMLINTPYHPVTRGQLLGITTGRDWNPSDRSVDIVIGKIRKKLEKHIKMQEVIRTIRNTGYMFVAPLA